LGLSIVIIKTLKIFHFPLMIMPPMPTSDLIWDQDNDYVN
jgi:hypothetical protein